jgi:lipopolysaccharide transport system ATP-binding protein
MPEPIIHVENLGKQYIIRHQTKDPYATLRDFIADKIKTIGRSVFTIPANHQTGSSREAFWALKDVSFDVKPGEAIGIVGRNGAGKTTLLKILSRITEPSIGRIRIKGRVGSLLEVGTGFHPELTGRENIFLNGAILGMSKRDIRKKFDEIVFFAEVEKFLDTPVKKYSSGMYVRLAFAVAAHLEPEILLVDEVLAVGDSAFQKKCLGKMGDAAIEGRTVLFVSHNMNAIRRFCRKAIWLDNGRIVKRGTPDEVVGDYEQSQIRHFDEFSYVAERSPKDVKNLSFYISRVEMQNTKGEKTNIFSYNDSFVLIVDVNGEPVESNYGLEFRIYKHSGEFAAVGTSGPLHGIYFNEKTKKVRIEVGPIILTNGKYTISLGIITESWIRTDAWDNACSFSIVECHPFALPQEIKTPVCVIGHSFSAVE